MTVTGQKSEVLELAGRIADLCDEHTSRIGIARAAIQIADTVMSARQFAWGLLYLGKFMLNLSQRVHDSR
jgi:hypothetical protein